MNQKIMLEKLKKELVMKNSQKLYEKIWIFISITKAFYADKVKASLSLGRRRRFSNFPPMQIIKL